jgi:hypothetical protein
LKESSLAQLKILLLTLEYSLGVGGGVGTHVQKLSTGLSLAGDFVTVLSGTVGSPNHSSMQTAAFIW